MRDLIARLIATAPRGDPDAAVAAAAVALFAEAAFGVAVLDAELRVVAANPSLHALAGDVRLGRPAAEALASGAALAAIAAEVRDTGHARRGAAWRELVCHCHPIRAAGRVVGVMCVIDEDRARWLGAERDAARAEQRLAHTALGAAAGFEDRLFAAMSHELRAPLATIQLWERALHDHPDDAALRAKGLAAIRQSAAAQTRLFDTLLDVGRSRRGKLHLELQTFDLQDELGAAIDRVADIAAARSLTLELHGEPPLGAITGDPVRLRQVLDQLLSNAVKFTPPGGLITVRARRAGDAAEIEVADTGVGIDPALLPHVLDAFLEAGDAAYRSGLGAGLALARVIVEAHGGTLDVRSEGDGRGATFAIELPGTAAGTATTQAPRAVAAPVDLRGLRVLVVDDDRDALEGLTVLLGAAGAAVTAAHTAAAAWQLLERGDYDALVSDIAMSDGDGYGLIRRVRAHPATRGLRAIALTAHVLHDVRDRAFAAGFDAHVTKPVDIDELAAVLVAPGAPITPPAPPGGP